jgi:hypothetical protein
MLDHYNVLQCHRNIILINDYIKTLLTPNFEHIVKMLWKHKYMTKTSLWDFSFYHGNLPTTSYLLQVFITWLWTTGQP